MIREAPTKILYMQSGVGDAHSRRMIEALAAYAHGQSPSWHVRWGPELPLDDLRAGKYAGLIFFYNDRETRQKIKACGVPVVQVGTELDSGDFHAVLPDHFGIGKMAAAHFRERLFREIAYVGDSRRIYSDTRRRGVRDSLKDGERFHSFDLASLQGPGDAALRKWLRALPEYTGLLGMNDYVARQVCHLCGEMDIAIPEHLAVLGVDNDDMLVLTSPVAFSSVDPGSAEIGTRTGIRMGELIEGRSVPERLTLVAPVGVVLRASTDHLATKDDKVAAAARMMREGACDGLKVEEICKRVGLGRRMFEMRFLREIGRTPEAEMRTLRMQRARLLLLSTNKSMQEIAEESGFRDGYYFSAAFKREHGLSPRAWRIKHS